MKTSRTERFLGIAIVVAMVFLLLVFSIFSGPEANTETGSVRSAADDGRRALSTMLTELGFAPAIRVEPPSELPKGPHVLWLSKVPTELLPGLRRDLRIDGSPEPKEQGLQRIGQHALEHYKDFVESGGTLIVPARDEVREFLVEKLGFEACGGIVRSTSAEARERLVRTNGGETLTLDVAHGGVFEPLDFNSPARPMWTVADGEREFPFVVTVPEGAGSVVLLADDSFVANEEIGHKDHALAAVRLVEELARGGTLFLDEYELGAWRPQSAYALAFTPKLVLVTLHLGLLLALFVWMAAFVRAFPRDPEPLELHSPLMRARAQATVLERAKRVELLAAFLRRGVFDRLAARVRLPRTREDLAASTRVTPATDAAANMGLAELAQPIARADVERLAAAVSAPELAPRLAIVLIERQVRDVADLDRLDLELRSLERDLEKRVHDRSRPGRGIPARTASN